MEQTNGHDASRLAESVLPPVFQIPKPIALVLKRQASGLSEANDAFLDAAHTVADRWWARRRAQMQAWRNLLSATTTAQTPAAAREACNEWFSGAIRRATEDVGDQIELCVKTTRRASVDVDLSLFDAEQSSSPQKDAQDGGVAKTDRRKKAAH